MYQVGEIVAPIVADLKGFTSGLASAKSQGISVAKDIKQSFQDIGKGMQNMGRNMSLAITAPLAGAGLMALKTASNYERLQIQINTLSGSAEKGAKIFKQLQEFSAGTPFQLDDLVRANNILVGMGQSTEDAFDNLQMLGDVASATGSNINELAVTFGQASAEGKLMTRDIREFINRGIPMTKLLADSMGVAQNQIFKLAEEGKISFEVVRKALQDATSGTGMYAGATEDAANSISGVFSTLKDNVSASLAELGNSIVDTLDLKEMIKGITEGVQQITENFKSLSDDAKKDLLLLAGILGASGPVLLAIGTLVTAVTAISLPVLGVIAVVAGIGFAFMEAYKQAGDATGAMELMLDKFLNHTVSVVQDMLKTMDWANLGVFDGAIGALEELKRNVEDTDAFTPLADATDFIKSTFDSLKTLTSGLRETYTGARDSGLEAVDAMKLYNDTIGETTDAVKSFSISQEEANKNLQWAISNLPKQTHEVENITGSVADLTEMLNMYQQSQLQANNPETWLIIQGLIDETKAKIESITGQASESGLAMMGFANALGQVFSQAVLHAQDLQGVLAGLLKQLASKAFVIGIGALLTGGASLGKKTFLQNLFGGVFHDGGIVPGTGEKMILAKGGEMVLNQAQQKALSLGMASSGGGGMSASQMETAFSNAMRKFVRGVSERQIFEMSEKGRYN